MSRQCLTIHTRTIRTLLYLKAIISALMRNYVLITRFGTTPYTASAFVLVMSSMAGCGRTPISIHEWDNGPQSHGIYWHVHSCEMKPSEKIHEHGLQVITIIIMVLNGTQNDVFLSEPTPSYSIGADLQYTVIYHDESQDMFSDEVPFGYRDSGAYRMYSRLKPAQWRSNEPIFIETTASSLTLQFFLSDHIRITDAKKVNIEVRAPIFLYALESHSYVRACLVIPVSIESGKISVSSSLKSYLVAAE